MSNQSNHPEQENTNEPKDSSKEKTALETHINIFNIETNKEFLEKIKNIFRTPVIVAQVAPQKTDAVNEKQDDNKSDKE